MYIRRHIYACKYAWVYMYVYVCLCIYLHIYVCIHMCVYRFFYLLATVVEGDPKVTFSIATTPTCRGRCYVSYWITPLTIYPYFMRLSDTEEGIKYDFLSLWYDSTRDWAPGFPVIGEHSTHLENVLKWVYEFVSIYLSIYHLNLDAW